MLHDSLSVLACCVTKHNTSTFMHEKTDVKLAGDDFMHEIVTFMHEKTVVKVIGYVTKHATSTFMHEIVMGKDKTLTFMHEIETSKDKTSTFMLHDVIRKHEKTVAKHIIESSKMLFSDDQVRKRNSCFFIHS
jgi:hypothetical protein